MKVNPANAYRNGPLYPSYTATAMKALFDLQDQAGVNLIAMLSWSFEFEGKDYFEGFRTLATNGIDKPILEPLPHGGSHVGRARRGHQAPARSRSPKLSPKASASHQISMPWPQRPITKPP